jgi:hypothetical protein
MWELPRPIVADFDLNFKTSSSEIYNVLKL